MFETVIILVLAGLGLIFRWFTNQSTREDGERQPNLPNEQIRRRPTESEEERVRRFLEALGMPKGSAPPPPVRPRPAPRRVITPKQVETPYPKRRTLVQPLPPLVTVPPDETQPELASTPASSAPALTPAFGLPGASLPEERSPGSPRQVPTVKRQSPKRVAEQAGTSSFALLLRDRRGLQQAIVLREILGPPRAFAPLGIERGSPGPI